MKSFSRGWALPALIFGALALSGCGEASLDNTGGSTAGAPAVAATNPQSHTIDLFSTVVSVTLNQGWNVIAFQTLDLTSLTVPPEVSVYNYYDASSSTPNHYVTVLGAPSIGGLTGSGTPPRAIQMYCSTKPSSQLLYDGTHRQTTFPATFVSIPLMQGANLVSFPSDVPVSSLELSYFQSGVGFVAPTTVLLTTKFTEKTQDGKAAIVDVSSSTAQLIPGRAYWIFTKSACNIQYGGSAP